MQRAREPGSFTQVDLVELALAGVSELADPRIQLEAIGSPVVSAPAEALANALRNLLVNALHYSTGTVWLRVGPGAVLEVQDQGPGVPEEALARLGEPFFRVGHNCEGSGLGLALVRQVVESTGGKLTFSNLAEGGFLARIEFVGGSDLLAAGLGS
jgi:signal transduction histidine kinase